MDTETPVKGQEPDAARREYLEVQPVDPLRDIDGRKTVVWIVGFVVLLFVSMWLLWELFAFVLGREHRRKVEERPPIELRDLRSWEASELGKTEDRGDGTERISIDEAIKRLGNK